jgi:hypothetical protein
MKKKWCAKISKWNGYSPKPRKNQKIISRVIRAKLLDELASKASKSRYNAIELVETGGHSHRDPAGFFTKLFLERIEFYKTLAATKTLLKKHSSQNVILSCAAIIKPEHPDISSQLEQLFPAVRARGIPTKESS